MAWIRRWRAGILFGLILILAGVCGGGIARADPAGETIRFSLSRLGDPVLDPHRVQGDLELHFNANVFEGLVDIDPRDGTLMPELATAWRWLDATTLEFDLRRGVTFHNGEPFTAETVRFNFERMAAVTDGFNWIRMVLPEYHHIEVVAPDRVRLHLTRHNSTVLYAARFFMMLPPGLLTAEGDAAFRHHPVGTGPFRIARLERTETGSLRTVHLVRFPAYWDPDRPKVGAAVFHFGLTQRESLDRLLAGSLDAMADLPVRDILTARKAGLTVMTKGQGLLTWLYFNLTEQKVDAPHWSPLVRRAILHAIDYPRILQVVYRNRAVVNQQWAFRGLPGHVADLPPYRYDPAKAHRLLAEAGYPGGGFGLTVTCDDVSRDEANIVRASLERLGIAVTIRVIDEATNNCILTAKGRPDSPCFKDLSTVDLMIGDFGWGVPHNFVQPMHTFALDAFASLVSPDYPDAETPGVLFDRAKTSFGGAEATQAWEDVTRYEYARLAIAGLVEKEAHFAARPDLDWPVFGPYDLSWARYDGVGPSSAD